MYMASYVVVGMVSHHIHRLDSDACPGFVRGGKAVKACFARFRQFDVGKSMMMMIVNKGLWLLHAASACRPWLQILRDS